MMLLCGDAECKKKKHDARAVLLVQQRTTVGDALVRLLAARTRVGSIMSARSNTWIVF
jgi:hypothetical protein